jgi:hypothetical protein
MITEEDSVSEANVDDHFPTAWIHPGAG